MEKSSAATSFADRHLGPRAADQTKMLEVLGWDSLDALIDAVVPTDIRMTEPLALPDALTEEGMLQQIKELADQNEVVPSMIGQGYYNTLTPPVIQRNILENPAWYTAYTPYQAEISQGRLEALLMFQTMVSDLCAMELANASLLDEATAAAEAMTLLHRLNKASTSNVFAVDQRCHPQTLDVIEVRAEPLGLDVWVGDLSDPQNLPLETFGCLVQYPATDGSIVRLEPLVDHAHSQGTLVAVATDLLALTLLTPPGEADADVVVGSSQRFGVPLGFGGPHAGFMAVRTAYRRSLPGRLVGVSVDSAGRPAMRLALQTREQHIRREKATSNICTAQVLLAVIAGMYAAWHGPDGLTGIALRAHHHAVRLATGLRNNGHRVLTETFFDTITVQVENADVIVAAALEQGVNLRRGSDTTVGISTDETTTTAQVESIWRAFGIEPADAGAEPLDDGSVAFAADLRRTSSFLTSPAFHKHQSETEMLRFLRRLSDRDLALDRAMIPLGSCTMKLNATAEMMPITWPEFGQIHPFAPLSQAAGYLQLFDQLESWLAEITGYDVVSLQPNAGSQGEFAGLLAIRQWHLSRGDDHRTVCLIPSSAHGTNAASAVMCGMQVVVVDTDDDGNVDLVDLKARIAEHATNLAALMVTYPSTHGVFETSIREICAIVHDAGGQVYLDGANLNAMVGLAQPGRFGADVSHLNLHKTFCIPHGGGGPGVGPIGVGAHLGPFIPNHSVVSEAGPDTSPGAVSAAPWGSAGILPIPWAYIAMMGADGLTAASRTAILSANYIAHRLKDHFPVLYTGNADLVAHECIVDLRPLKDEVGVDVEDVAKRLIDYGFHAPTMSFPVPGTLMIEPTESEPLSEIDRFCEAMIAIKAEADQVGAGVWPAGDNPLVNAPHTAQDVTADEWTHAYPRSVAAWPNQESDTTDKYWPPVSRVDNAHGDKNLACDCPSLDSYR